MPRDFQVNGETLVTVQGGAHFGNGPIAVSSELGLTSEAIQVTPRFCYKNIHVDDFGPDIPAEVMCQLAEVRIKMTLIHYDDYVLDCCIGESMGGVQIPITEVGGARTNFPEHVVTPSVGLLNPAGTLLGGNVPRLSSGNHFVTLLLNSPVLDKPWRFLTCHLTGPPLEIPLGTNRVAAICEWKAIPYATQERKSTTVTLHGSILEFGDVASSGVVLWDRKSETDAD